MAAANPSNEYGEEKQACAMGMQCYHVRKLGSPEPETLGPSHEGPICDKCMHHPGRGELLHGHPDLGYAEIGQTYLARRR